jgi:hypothetical protein
MLLFRLLEEPFCSEAAQESRQRTCDRREYCKLSALRATRCMQREASDAMESWVTNSHLWRFLQRILVSFPFCFSHLCLLQLHVPWHSQCNRPLCLDELSRPIVLVCISISALQRLLNIYSSMEHQTFLSSRNATYHFTSTFRFAPLHGSNACWYWSGIALNCC